MKIVARWNEKLFEREEAAAVGQSAMALIIEAMAVFLRELEQRFQDDETLLDEIASTIEDTKKETSITDTMEE
jgi:hypothetical protein